MAGKRNMPKNAAMITMMAKQAGCQALTPRSRWSASITTTDQTMTGGYLPLLGSGNHAQRVADDLGRSQSGDDIHRGLAWEMP